MLLSCAISVDGYLDAPGPERLVLSGDADLDRVDSERAQSDAILVGAGTIRRDDPRLLIRAPERRAARAAAGLAEHPAGVTLTASGDLDPGARFFTLAAGADRLVYCPAPLVPGLRARLAGRARVIAIPPPGLPAVLADLYRRGMRRLLVEGGARLSREFLAAGLVDELELAVAPFFVGAATAPRFAGPALYPHGPRRPMRLADVRRLDEIVLLRYLLEANEQDANGGDAAQRVGAAPDGPAPGPPGAGAEATAADRAWLARAVEESRRCPPSRTAFCVGAIIVAADGTLLAAGYSREASPHDHAEETALAKLDLADPRLAGATLYSSLEPCRSRASRPRPCAELVLAAGLRRVVIAWLEPPVFAPGGGAALLREAGITVVEVPGLAARARAVNAAVLGG